MEERTRAYLRGRFGDHYRRVDPDPPPDADRREWGHIPWTSGPGTTMVRHQSLLELGDLEGFLEHERPRHVYFSAGRYDDPGAGQMEDKRRQSSDLVFDLDADHLPAVDPSEATYAEMLSACKDALYRLLDFLEDDFGFDDLTVVFSGGRGYHVHVRDPGVQQLGSDERREIVDYVRGIGFEPESVIETVQRGRVTKRELRTEGGWGRRAHRRMLSFLDELRELPEADAIERLQSFDGIGEGRAAAIHNAVETNYDRLADGDAELGGTGIRTLAATFAREAVAEETAPIDEPVTTDVNRLIRLPGSLHGGSGLAVRHIPRDELSAFDPLVDTVPETFRGHEITVEVSDGGRIELDGRTFTVEEGDRSVPEYVGVFLMTRGRAEKGRES